MKFYAYISTLRKLNATGKVSNDLLLLIALSAASETLSLKIIKVIKIFCQ